MKIRGMTSGRLASVLLVSASLGLATAVSAAVVPGGGKKSTDCAAGFEVEGTTNPTTVTSNKTKVKQKACSHSCTFSVKTCINEPVTGCTATPVTSFVPPSLPPLDLPAVGGSDHVCGSSVDVTVAEKHSMKFKLTANTSGKPDKDTLILACLKNKNDKAGSCGLPPGPTCAKNTAGGPDQVTFTVLGQGTDLDNGWTGTSHNFPVIKDASVVFCLSGCDSSTNPICQANGPTGPPPALNGQFFGPPLPLIAGGVPVCVVNRYSGNVTGTGNVQTGEMNGLIPLFSDVFATDPTRVCPQCLNGTCDSGGKRGQSCHVDGSVTVVQSLATNKDFQLSKDCPPLGQPLATLTINLPITTATIGTPGTGGSKPCREKEAQGVPVKDNNCSGGCVTGSCTGAACVTHVADPSNPAAMICVDSKGGLSQACCADNPSVPCFDTGPGGAGINRTGRAVAPTPAWPDTTYPKTADGVVTVATFCEAATGSSNIDTVTGLPGPGAVVFNNKATWDKAP